MAVSGGFAHPGGRFGAQPPCGGVVQVRGGGQPACVGEAAGPGDQSRCEGVQRRRIGGEASVSCLWQGVLPALC